MGKIVQSENYWDQIEENLSELSENGYTRLPSLECFNLERAYQSISEEMGEQTYKESGESHGKFLDQIGLRSILGPKLFELAKKDFGYKGTISDQYHIARYVQGGDESESFRAHFDAHLYTLVLPIRIPKVLSEDDTIGDLVFFPHVRKYPKSELRNIFDKFYFKRYASKTGINRLSKKKLMITENFQSYRPVIFSGLTSLHANKVVSLNASGNRLTLLAHFFDPNPNYGISYLLRVIRSR